MATEPADPAALIRSAAYQVGAIRVTTVADGLRRLPLADGFILNAERAEVAEALAAASLPRNEITIHFNPIVIETAGYRALIDTGNGAQAPGASSGLMTQSLASAGIDPGSIDTVIISHFHGDHVLGLLAPGGGLAFPRAKVLVPAPEWAFWMDDAAMAAAPAGRMAQLFETNRRILAAVTERVVQYSWGDEILPGIVAEGTPGHTVGHTSFNIESDGERLFVQSDVTNNPAIFLTHPGWHAAFDQDPIQAETTRRRVLDHVAAQRIPVQGFHFPFPARGFVEADGPGYRLSAIG